MRSVPPSSVFDRLDRYADAVPRSDAVAEDHGALTLFVDQTGAFTYYARPRPGVRRIHPKDILAVRRRQRALRLPASFEWLCRRRWPGGDQPGCAGACGVRSGCHRMGAAARSVGMRFTEHPVLALDRPAPLARPVGFAVRILSPEASDLELASALAVTRVGFDAPGMARGPAGPAEVAAAIRGINVASLRAVRRRLRTGASVIAVAERNGMCVGTGTHRPVGAVSEIVAVTTVPSQRGIGIASAVTGALARSALAAGRTTVFLAASDHAVARVYQRLGFRPIATTCVGELA